MDSLVAEDIEDLNLHVVVQGPNPPCGGRDITIICDCQTPANGQ